MKCTLNWIRKLAQSAKFKVNFRIECLVAHYPWEIFKLQFQKRNEAVSNIDISSLYLASRKLEILEWHPESTTHQFDTKIPRVISWQKQPRKIRLPNWCSLMAALQPTRVPRTTPHPPKTPNQKILILSKYLQLYQNKSYYRIFVIKQFLKILARLYT
jgi:hypothetical protein